MKLKEIYKTPYQQPKIWQRIQLWCQEGVLLKWSFPTGFYIIYKLFMYRLNEKAKTVEGQEQLPLRALAYALEVIPRTLAQNCGADVVRVLTQLRAKHAGVDGKNFGIDGITGEIKNMKDINIWEPLAVK